MTENKENEQQPSGKKEIETKENIVAASAETKTDVNEKNVKCSFCGDDTSCESCVVHPEDVQKFEHMCYGCYQKMGQPPENVRDKTHLCLPPEEMAKNFQRFLDDVTYKAFIDLWNSEKKKLKEMSRQDLCQASFFEGARFMFAFMQQMSKDHEHVHEEHKK